MSDNIGVVRAAGVNGMRDEAPWSQVERQKGQYVFPDRSDAAINAAHASGIEVVIPLGYGDRFYDSGGNPLTPDGLAGYAAYWRFVVTHLRGPVWHYEVWNEYDIGFGTPTATPGTPENYLKRLAVTGEAIRAADPACAVGILSHCVGASVHPYNYRAPRRPPPARGTGYERGPS